MKLTCPARTRWIAALCCILSTMYGAYAQEPGAHTDLSKQEPIVPLSEVAITRINNEVRGTVTDSAGSPMPGVSVFVKTQPNIGTTTDLNGKYILSVPADNAVLVFTMVGFDNQEMPVKGKEVINILMK